jgi:hypothetical protein
MRNCIDEGTLQAWFDSELAADEAANVAAHLNGCVQCAEAARMVEAENLILSEGLATEFAAEIPTEQLRQRVDAAVAAFRHASVPSVSQSRWRAIHEFFASFRPLAYASIAATMLLAGFVGFVYLRRERATPGTAQNNAPSVLPAISKGPDGTPPMPAPPLSPKIEKVRGSKVMSRRRASEPDAMSLSWQERQYDYAIAKLNEAIKVQPPMRPSLQVEYEYNMALIDNAIATSRDAARRNPKDPQAAQFMLAAYQSKVDLMNEIANARVSEK